MCTWLYKILAAYYLHCKEQKNDKIDVSTPSINPLLQKNDKIDVSSPSINPSLATLSGYKYYHLIVLPLPLLLYMQKFPAWLVK